MYRATEIHLHLGHVSAAHRQVLAASGYAFRPLHPGTNLLPPAKRVDRGSDRPRRRMTASATPPEPIFFNPRSPSSRKMPTVDQAGRPGGQSSTTAPAPPTSPAPCPPAACAGVTHDSTASRRPDRTECPADKASSPGQQSPCSQSRIGTWSSSATTATGEVLRHCVTNCCSSPEPSPDDEYREYEVDRRGHRREQQTL
jgi:hypothetical protein